MGLPSPHGTTFGATRRSPTWVRVPALLAPIALIGGWTVAAELQSSPAAASWATISELAAHYARHRAVMTVALLVTGACFAAIAVGLHSVRPAGRLALSVSGVGIVGVAVAPLPTHPALHSLSAFVAFAALVLWPACGMRGGGGRRIEPGAAGRATLAGAVLMIVLYAAPDLLGGFGVVERLLSGGGCLWLCLVVFDCTRACRG